MNDVAKEYAVHLGENDDFSSVVSKGIVLVDFYADWCGPCKMVGPVLEEIAKAYHGKVTILKVDVDIHGDVASQYAVTSIPTVIVFKDGEFVGQPMIGAYDKSHYENILEDLVGQSDSG